MFALVSAVAVVIASAYAFGHPIIDFGSAPKGPEKVVNDFGSLEVGAPAGMAQGFCPRRLAASRPCRSTARNTFSGLRPPNRAASASPGLSS